MNFGSVCIKLCSVIAVFWVASICAQQTKISAHLQLKSTAAKEAYSSFIQRFDECGDKKARKNHPYPVNDWLLSLPLRKQSSVVMYLLSNTEYQCYEVELNEMIEVLRSNQDHRALNILESEGWLSKPVYGQYSFTNKKDLELTESDHEALSLLLNMKYLPFDLIGMGELLKELREHRNK